jgi:lysophospholipase L1-like esterase
MTYRKMFLKGLVVLLFLLPSHIFAQEGLPFWKDIQQFKKQDSLQKPPSNAILLIGSSSFTIWKDVQDYFKGYTIINRGFGGSTLVDQLRYINDVVFPYQPKQILIYCGENDLASSDTVTAKMVFSRFQQLFNLIRNRLPRVHIAFVSMKPSPSRELLMSKMREGNEMIRKFLRGKRRTAYIDVYKEMIDDEGKPIPTLFLDDNLHMNKEGYVIWQRVIQPYLLK